MQSHLVTTSDGSHTLYVPQIDEHYHSVNGAVQESMHIFINAALRECTKQDVHVLEIGFGTGLNTFLTLLEAERTSKNILFTTIELYPIDSKAVEILNYAEQVDSCKSAEFKKLHTVEWNKKTVITQQFSLEKICTDFTTFDFTEQYDVVFFDAFSPEKQPEMWTGEIFSRIYQACNSNAVLTTYCAKGAVRRAMQKANFSVERIPGPPGKREILRCRKI